MWELVSSNSVGLPYFRRIFVRRPAAAVPDDAGQYVADAGPTPSVTEARDSDAAT